MATFDSVLERHHRAIIFPLVFVVAFFAVACTYHELIPVCHFIFGCDHGLHSTL